MSDVKTCKKCGKTKPRSDFPKKNTVHQCKSCKNLYDGMMHWRKKTGGLIGPSIPEDHKQCGNCKQILPFEQFHKQELGRGGVGSLCKHCTAEYDKSRWDTDEFRTKQRERRRERLAQEPEFREYIRAKNREHGPAMRAKLRSYYTMKKREYDAAKRGATPEWSETAAILELYEEARRLTETTGIPHEVDHVIPLQGENTCRAIQSMLHAMWNLQVIPANENRSKSNKLVTDRDIA